jgi:3-hydroxyisobutyrate dehydrogenase-like beta-hydroxyacid dehydrogenase
MQGVDFVDAPVTGGSIGAEAATLATMMGGDDHAVAKLLPILAYYTKTQLHMGRSGSGQITKLCNQIAQIITIQGVAEAMQFAAAYGADQRAVMNVLSSGFANSRMLELLAPKMIDQDFTPLMKSQLLDKDAGIAKMAAKAKELNMPGLNLVAAQLADVQDRGWQEQDVSILIKALEPKKKKR